MITMELEKLLIFASKFIVNFLRTNKRDYYERRQKTIPLA